MINWSRIYLNLKFWNIKFEKGYVPELHEKIHKDDKTIEEIVEFKISDLYVPEWKEMMEYTGHKEGKRWTQGIDAIKAKLNEIHAMEAFLDIKTGESLKNEDPIMLNKLARKRKRDDDPPQESSLPWNSR